MPDFAKQRLVLKNELKGFFCVSLRFIGISFKHEAADGDAASTKSEFGANEIPVVHGEDVIGYVVKGGTGVCFDAFDFFLNEGLIDNQE